MRKGSELGSDAEPDQPAILHPDASQFWKPSGTDDKVLVRSLKLKDCYNFPATFKSTGQFLFNHDETSDKPKMKNVLKNF